MRNMQPHFSDAHDASSMTHLAKDVGRGCRSRIAAYCELAVLAPGSLICALLVLALFPRPLYRDPNDQKLARRLA